MTTTIATLEAKARINRDQWNADKAALYADVDQISRKLDELQGRATRPANSPTTSGAQSSPTANTTALVDANDKATQSLTRLTQAQRAQLDPVRQQAQLIRQTQSALRDYTLAMGDAHPQTLALKQRLDELKSTQINSGQQTLTLKQQLGQLITTMGEGENAATGFGRGLLQSVGGISLIAGGAAAAGAAVAQVTQRIVNMFLQTAEAGIKGNTQIEQYATGFGVLLGNVDAAQKRIADLVQFANVTPFRVDEVTNADRVLQTFGGTALATGKNLTLVGDIASGVERPFNDVALWVGRAYDALQNGRPWGEAALRLQEMGALSGTARARLEAMQAQGVSGTKIWDAFTQEMAKFNGMMDVQSKTAQGLSSTLQDLVSQAERTASMPLFERFKQTLQFGTSAEGAKQLQAASQGAASGLSFLIDTGEALYKTFGQQLVGTFKDLSTEIAWADKTFGLFGHHFDGTLSDAQKHSTDFFNSVSSDISSVTGTFGDYQKQVDNVLATVSGDFNTNHGEIQKALEASGHAMTSQQNTTASVLQTLQSDLSRVTSLYQRDSQIAQSTAGEVGKSAAKRAADEMVTLSQLRTAIEAERQLYASLADSANFTAQTSAHAASERASTYGTTVPTQNQVNKDVKRQDLAGQLVDSIQQVQQQTVIANLQASSSVFQQAQIQSQKAQAEAQAAIDRLKLGDQSFLQGAAAQQITGTQLQTAIDRVKLNNSALMDASIQADAAQMEVQAAITRIRGTNALLLGAQLDQETASTQATTALERAKAGSAAYNQAQVAAEKAQRDAQDALDTARVKAGLIDPTQTAAYQRARQQMITPVELAKQQLEDVYSIVKTGLDTATTLSNLYIPAGAISKMGQVTDFEDQLFQAQQKVADKFSRENIIKLYDFGQAAAQGIAYFSSGVNALADVAKLEIAPPDKTGIDAALSNIDYIFEAIDKEAQKHGPAETAKAGIFAQTGQSIAAMLSSWASAFSSLQPQRFDLRGQINLAFENIDRSLTDLAVYSARWKNKASDERRQIADNVGAILKSLNDALSPFASIQQAGMVGDYEIDLAINNVEHALTKMGDLADSPVLQGQSLTRLQQASSTLGSVFSGLKTALDTLTGLTSMADSTGNIDVGYSLDQFFLTQVPTYADTWEKAMLRIGNASEGVAGRVKGAFGTPSTQNAMAGAGTSGTGNGNTYVLNIDASKDPVIDDLIKKIFDRVSLKQGGVLVGVGG